jgi:hypothetical protein
MAGLPVEIGLRHHRRLKKNKTDIVNTAAHIRGTLKEGLDSMCGFWIVRRCLVAHE